MATDYINGQIFITELATRLRSNNGWEVEMPFSGSTADFIVKDNKSDKRIYIDVKDAKGYGELPMYSIIPISNLVKSSKKSDRVILVSLSDISSLLFGKLQELNVLSLIKPTVDKVLQEVSVAMAS